MIRRVELDEAIALLAEGYRYIDVRTEQEYLQGHPVGAYNVPWLLIARAGMVENEDFMAVMRRNFETDARLLLGCRSGHRSLAAARRLEGAGYVHLCELRCGFAGTSDPFGRAMEPGWQSAGLPCAGEPEPGHDYRALVDPCTCK